MERLEKGGDEAIACGRMPPDERSFATEWPNRDLPKLRYDQHRMHGFVIPCKKNVLLEHWFTTSESRLS